VKVKLPFSCAKLGDLMISEGNLEEGFNACQQTLEIRKKALALCLLLFFIAAGGSLQSLSAAPASITIAVTQVLTRPDSGNANLLLAKKIPDFTHSLSRASGHGRQSRRY